MLTSTEWRGVDVGAADPFESFARAAKSTAIPRGRSVRSSRRPRKLCVGPAAATTTPADHPVSFRLAVADTELDAGQGFELGAPRWSVRLNERGALRISQA
jgi:hypothetical protein